MPITAITIENFKGIKDPVRVELKPITLLFGPNSAGKSTIVQALHYAREIFERQNLNPDKTLLGGEAIDLGGFQSLVHKHDTTLPIRIKIELDLTREELPSYLEDGYDNLNLLKVAGSAFWSTPDNINTAWVEIVIRWNNLLDKPLLVSYKVWANGEILVNIETTEDGKQVNLTWLNLLNPIFLGGSSEEDVKNTINKMAEGEDLNDEDNERLKVSLMFLDLTNTSDGIPGVSKNIVMTGQNSAMPKWGTPLKFDQALWENKHTIDEGQEQDSVIQLLSSLITGPGELIRDGLRKLCYVGPLREVPKRNHKTAISPDESRWANGLAAYDTLFYAEDDFIDRINDWLSNEDRFASGYSVDVKKYRELEINNPVMLAVLQDRILDEDVNLREKLLELPIKRRLLIRDEKRDIELDPQDIGVGISQVLPVVVAALHNRTGFVAIEQPELHIHPAFQVALGDLFIERIKECSDLNFILETHSEHLMLRLLRRIRETGEQKVPDKQQLAPSDLSIYFIEQEDTGISCKSIRVDEEGDFIDRWPKGFFAERAKELF